MNYVASESKITNLQYQKICKYYTADTHICYHSVLLAIFWACTFFATIFIFVSLVVEKEFMRMICVQWLSFNVYFPRFYSYYNRNKSIRTVQSRTNLLTTEYKYWNKLRSVHYIWLKNKMCSK